MPETIKDLMPETPDLNQERLDALKQILPDIFTDEGKLDEKQLKRILDAATNDEQRATIPEVYEFNWFGKAKAKEQAYTPTRLTLQYDPKRSFNAEHSENVIIEGENLEVLKLLLCGYRGQIKCIYIDPPYNTGKDFVYSDKHAISYNEYLEKTGKMRDGIKTDANADTSGRYHSDWLSMMYSRLIVAQQLLKKDGVIFISIDDNEVHNLRKICDEIFGVDNLIAEIPWKGKGGGADNQYLMVAHEYVLFYAKDKSSFDVGEQIKEDEVFPKFDEEKKRNYKTQLARKWGSNSKRTDRPNLYYPIVSPITGKEVYPMLPDSEEGCWRWSKETMARELADGNLEFAIVDDGSEIVYEKIYEPKEGEFNTKKYSTWLDDVGNTATGTKELTELFSTKVFSFPKPTTLVKRLLNIADLAGNDIVLDFFGGSGTSGHSSMELNLGDGGNRKFIIAQLPQATDPDSEAFKAGFKKISDITIERNKRVAEKLSTDEKQTRLQSLHIRKVILSAD